MPARGWLRVWFSTLAVAAVLSCNSNAHLPTTDNLGSDESDTLDNQVDLEKLLGRWVHAHEEDDGNKVIYRVSGYAFPPSRGRDAFTLDQNGVVRIDHPGPVDRGVSATGRWVLDGDVLSIDAGNWSAEFTIESFDGTTLVMHRR